MATISPSEDRRIIPPRRTVPEEIVRETGISVSHGMWGVVIFIASEVMFFAALFTAYFYLRTQIGWVDWAPPEGHRPVVWPFTSSDIADAVPTLNTIVLVSSSLTIQLGMNRLKVGDRRTFIRLLVLTMALGTVFLGGQAKEYVELYQENVTFQQGGAFGAVFFGLTGFHGGHVSGGVLFFLVILARALAGQFSARRHLGAEAASIYWHFVDVVWIGLYTTLYIL